MSGVPPLVLVTGGLGYIGSHTVVELAEAGFRSLILDDLSNSSFDVLERLGALCRFPPLFQRGDVRDTELLRRVLLQHPVGCAVHFAGLKAVGESVRQPLDYYSVNVVGTVSLMKALQEASTPKLVFSSSATVYGQPTITPIPESHAVAPENPYGRSKLMAEQVMQDACRANPDWSVMCLRYFNPAGAHPSGRLGEKPSGTPNNLMPYISQVGSGERPVLEVFGTDYPTSDGTGVRDYVHVVDLARARREGDVAVSVADPSLAAAKLGWRSVHSLDDMCRDAARFERISGDRPAFSSV